MKMLCLNEQSRHRPQGKQPFQVLPNLRPAERSAQTIRRPKTVQSFSAAYSTGHAPVMMAVGISTTTCGLMQR